MLLALTAAPGYGGVAPDSIADPADDATAVAPLEAHLAHLEERLDVSTRAAATGDRETARWRHHLNFLASRVEALPPGSRTRDLRWRLRALRQRLLAPADAEPAGPSQPPSSRLPSVSVPPSGTTPTANDRCDDAISIGEGIVYGATVGADRDGLARCFGEPLKGLAPDVWYRFSSPIPGRVFATVVGEGSFAPVLSAHAACPGTERNQLECAGGSDGPGVLDLPVAVGQEILLRVSGVGSATGFFSLEVGRGGSIGGRVTAEADGRPLAGIAVDLFDESERRVDGTTTDGAGRYSFTRLRPSTYFVLAGDGSGFVRTLFGGVPCVNVTYYEDCRPSDGDPIVVGANTVADGIDVALPLGGTISGTVRAAVTGEPLPYATVELYDVDGVDPVATANVDAEGRYRLVALPAGTYFALVTGAAGFADQRFDGLTCPSSGSCDPTAGTPIEVALGTEVRGVDFALERLGAITGSVTDAVTGEPIPFVTLELFSDGFLAARATSEIDGSFVLGNLAAGAYTLATFSQQRYLDEVYDDRLCPRPPFGICEPDSGTPIAVQLGQVTAGIDFSLEPGGVIRGTVRAADTGMPLVYWDVGLWLANGVSARTSRTDDAGAYEFRALPAGSYFVATERSPFDRYENVLYDGIVCPVRDCDPTAGTPVVASPERPTEGIDFRLPRRGSVAGRVTARVGGEALAYVDVTLVDGGGVFVERSSSNADGRFVLENLDPGTYFAIARQRDGPHLPQIYDEISCFRDCEVTAGTPIQVTLDAVTDGIDFALDLGGFITGRVIDAVTGEPLPPFGAQVIALDFEGTFMTDAELDEEGRFQLTGLPTDRYAVVVDAREEYLDEAWDDVPCPVVRSCFALGTPIMVTQGRESSGIDFALDRLGTIAGQARAADTGLGIADVRIEIYDTGGSRIGVQNTDSAGRYRTRGLSPGRYFIAAGGGFDTVYARQLYDGLSCPPHACDPTSGTPVDVALAAETSDIDFELEPAGVITGTVTYAYSGLPAGGVSVVAWLDGREVADSGTDFAGRYRIDTLNPGSYKVSTQSYDFVDEVWDDVACPEYGCDPAAGAPIVVRSGATTSGIDFALEPRGNCIESDTALCVGSGRRFRVEAAWRTPAGASGVARAMPLTEDTGYFWFFNERNVELLVKVLDACERFDRFWVFAAGLTNVEVELTVTDTLTAETRTYLNPLGVPFQPIQDAAAFDTCEATGSAAFPELPPASALGRGVDGLPPAMPSPETRAVPRLASATDNGDRIAVGCVADAETLCLRDGRFAVRGHWRVGSGPSRLARAEPLTSDTGLFWFVRATNIELVVKVLDACGRFDRFWVFAGGLTNVEVELEVTDTASGEVRLYRNPFGTPFQPIQDTAAFATCP